ncbi:MAG: hypothetical protein WKF89_09245 [Chitinophagaceae bacterium]
MEFYTNSKNNAKASFSSGQYLYAFSYDGNHIKEMKNNTQANKDRIQ